MPARGARSWPLAGKSSIHHREDAGMNILLNLQKINERIVDDAVRPVAFFIQQSTEGVLHCTSDVSEDMGLHRRQMEDVLVVEKFWDADAVLVNSVEHEERLLGFVRDPLDIFEVRFNRLQTVLVLNESVAIVNLRLASVDDDRVVVRCDQYLARITVGDEPLDYGFQLPR